MTMNVLHQSRRIDGVNKIASKLKCIRPHSVDGIKQDLLILSYYLKQVVIANKVDILA